ncbi:MAG: family 10 glycosylhydrolase, partial [Clostridiales bacterium]|nr:family 10 glycosylhydrolase [Clostridiales bacterium]
DDWRRNNVDIFVSELYAAVKNVNADIAFGISPFGIWANSSTNPLGSNTNGGESYTQHYADTRKWVKEGILDYIAPQIYWSIGHKNADYDTLTRWWADVVKDTNVKLYIGHAAYKVGSEWSDVFALMAQLELNRGIKEISGSIFFRYGFMKKDVKNAVKSFYTGKKTEPGKYSLKINLPAKDITTSQSDYYVGGTSDSAYPLYLNGELISSRSGDGFFGTLVKLEKGENVLKFTQNDQSVTRTITHRCLSSSSKGQSEATITSMFPTVNTYYAPGDTVTFTCTAPIGSIVRITFDGKTYQMYPDNTTPPDFRSVHLTTYTYDFTLPKGNNLSLGSAVYSMAYRGKKVRLLSNGEIYVISSENVTYARVKNDLTSGYSKPSSSGGPNVILSKNMSDIVTGRSGSYVKLGSNLWVYARNLEFYGKKSETSKLSNASMTVDVNGVNILTFMINDGTVYAKYDDTERTLNISVSPCKMGPKLRISSKSMFSSVDISQNNQKAIYRLKLKDEFTLGGYYTEAADGVLSLHVNPGISANIGYKPLSGHTIVVDAGHGGYDTGALGLLGADMPEKTINLDISLKLRDELTSLGAKVIMTRETDTYLSLEERLDISYLIKPDLFISVHCNSMNTNVDSSKVSGFSVFFREKTSSDAAKTIFNYLNDNLDLDNKGCHQANFYVVRGTWSPAVIFESAFMPNPSDFENLINEEWQAKLAKTLAMAITEYFK